MSVASRLSPDRIVLLLLALLAPACGLSEFPSSDVDAAPAPSPGPSPTPTPTPAPSPSPGPAPARPDAAAPPSDAGRGRDANRTPDARVDANAPAPAPAPMPPPTGSDPVVIGGMSLPRDKVIVFLHVGHSNMAGRTNTPVSERPFHFEPHPRLWAFGTAGFVPAKEPLSGDYLTRGRAGPGMSILRTANALAPDLTIVSIGRGQDGSRGGECKAFRRGGLFYETVMGPARQLKGKVTFGGIFSMLVLMDVYDKRTLPRANECYEAVAADMRADLGDPEIPFIMSDWEMGATGEFDPTRPDAVTARAKLRVAQMNIPRSLIVPTDMLPMSDNHHFDLVGYKMWAERAFGLMKQQGWTPWASE